MKKKTILFAILAITIILALVLIFVLLDRKKSPDDSKDSANDNIKKISLVYRYTNHAWGIADYAYLIDPDGTVFEFNYVNQHEDYVKISDVSQEFLDDLLKNTDSENYVGKNKTNTFSDEITEILKSIKYDSIDLEYKNYAEDAGNNCYYCLVEYEDHSKLIKIKETGDKISTNKNRNTDKICSYIDSVLKIESNY